MWNMGSYKIQHFLQCCTYLLCWLGLLFACLFNFRKRSWMCLQKELFYLLEKLKMATFLSSFEKSSLQFEISRGIFFIDCLSVIISLLISDGIINSPSLCMDFVLLVFSQYLSFQKAYQSLKKAQILLTHLCLGKYSKIECVLS